MESGKVGKLGKHAPPCGNPGTQSSPDNDPAAGGEKDCHHTRAALLERSRGQVRGERDFSAEISHEEAHLQEAIRSS